MENRTAYKVPEFCDANGISQSKYYELKRAGRGPREMRIGSKGVRISKEASEEWRRRMEEIAAEEIAAAEEIVAAESASSHVKEKDAEESASSEEEAA
jgi:predicted DNA-binding transcriptional regulator AlpA